MKYIILFNIKDLTKSAVGVAVITSKLYVTLRDNNFAQVRLFVSDDDIPEGKGPVRVQDNKLFTADGIYKCELVDLSKCNTIVFEPGPMFDKLGIGYAKQIDVLSMSEDKAKDNAILLLSEKQGPSTWVDCVLEDEGLDFGGQEVIDIIALM